MRRGLLSVLTLGTLVSGCITDMDPLTGRYGPSPIPVAATFESAVARQRSVVMAMARGAFPDEQPPRNRDDWYLVILAGFNVVDDSCISYIDDLWILERRKARNGALIAATGAAVAGIIAAGGNPSASTLAILAQAFGLAAAFNIAISDSYLYTQNAATIKKLILKTTEAYRLDLAANFTRGELDYPVASIPAAYHHIREYLSLCLPPTIQAQIEDLVTNAKAAPAPTGGGAGPQLVAPRVSTTGRIPAGTPSRTSPSIRVF